MLVEYCDRNRLAFIPYFPLDAGHASATTNLSEVAKKYEASVFQIALAWLLHRSKAILPIPGTKSRKHLEENVAAAEIRLTDDDVRLLQPQR
jgi:aryl-alcohol dehydrogenase-like predicted oxidoreductase